MSKNRPLTINILLGNLKPHLWELNSDSIAFVKGALEANGVIVKIGVEHIDFKAINLFFDRFYIDPKMPLQLKAAGVKFGIVCTESISPDGKWNKGAEGLNGETHASFELAARSANFVWCQLPESLEICRKMNPNTGYLRYGYLRSIEKLRFIPFWDRDIDVLQCGIPTPRREQIVKTLRDAGYSTCYPTAPVPQFIRDGLMARTKLNLSLQKTDIHDIVSVTRICHSVINRVPVLLETSSMGSEYINFCMTTTRENMVDNVLNYLDNENLEKWSARNYQKLADELPMDRFMKDLIEETI